MKKLCVLLICLMIPMTAWAIDGYKDLKFGMTEPEAKSTKAVKEGVVLFAEKRAVEYRIAEKEGVVIIYVRFGEYNEENRTKLLNVLSKKYKLVLEPSDVDYSNYNKDVGNNYDIQTVSLFQLAGAFDRLVIRKLAWDFENGQVSFVIGKMIYAIDDYNLGNKDIIYLVYRNKELAKTYYDEEIVKKMHMRNTKTSADDF